MNTRRVELSWLDFTADLLTRPLSELPREEIARQLIDSFDSDGCALTSTSKNSENSVFWPPDSWGGPLEYDNAEIAALESSGHNPIVQFYAATGGTLATQIADVPTIFHKDWQRRGLDSYYR